MQHYEREKRTQFSRYGINEWTKSRFEVIVRSDGPNENWTEISRELDFLMNSTSIFFKQNQNILVIKINDRIVQN